MIETICSNCGNIRIFEDSFAGKKFKCPSCGNVVEIKLLETETIVETDNVSNASVEDAVSKRRQELANAKKKLSDKELRIQKKREKEDAEIERILQERLEHSRKIFEREKKSLYIYPLCYAFIIIYNAYIKHYLWQNDFMDFINGIITVLAWAGWIFVIEKFISYKSHKMSWFGGNSNMEFTEECIEETRKSIIHEKFPYREKSDDIDIEKIGDDLKKVMYELDQHDKLNR